MKRRRRVRFGALAGWLLAAALLTVLLALRFPGSGAGEWLRRIFPGEPAAPAELHGPYPLLYVVDGDTLQLSVDGEEKRVRLIGVDAPESVHWDKEKNSPEGERAAAYLRELLEKTDGRLYLAYDEQTEDRFGRTLAYVYLSDAETMLQELLLRAGMVEPLPIEPNGTYSELFDRLNREARREKAGLYGGPTP